jgi:hypothetical protein
MFRSLVIPTMTFCIVISDSRSNASEVLHFRNDTARSMEVWVCPRPTQHWRSDCPIRIGPGNSTPIRFGSNVEHFLLLRDDLRREWRLGWHNITEVRQEHPDYEEISLSAYTVCRQAMVLVWDFRSQSWIRGPEEEPEVRYEITWGPRRTSPQPYEVMPYPPPCGPCLQPCWPPCQVPACRPPCGSYPGPWACW